MASPSKDTSRRPKAESKKPKSTAKTKGNTKTKAKAKKAAEPALAAVEGEDVDMRRGDQVAAKAAGEVSDLAEEDNDSGEEELEDAEERKSASKRCAFSRLLTTAHSELLVSVRKQLWIGGMRWMWKVGKSAIRMSSVLLRCAPMPHY